MSALRELRPDIAFQASGGVADLADLKALRTAGADAVIIGRALYENRFTLEDALAV
jgi:phosphoribosylformimino-5-aminoimidazole carboxamide ribotide isomerase